MGIRDDELLGLERAIGNATRYNRPETRVDFVCGETSFMRFLQVVVPLVGDHVDIGDGEHEPLPHVRVTGIVRRRTWTTNRGGDVVLRLDVAPEEPAATEPR